MNWSSLEFIRPLTWPDVTQAHSNLAGGEHPRIDICVAVTKNAWFARHSLLEVPQARTDKHDYDVGSASGNSFWDQMINSLSPTHHECLGGPPENRWWAVRGINVTPCYCCISLSYITVVGHNIHLLNIQREALMMLQLTCWTATW